jgi:hypothetical protein
MVSTTVPVRHILDEHGDEWQVRHRGMRIGIPCSGARRSFSHACRMGRRVSSRPPSFDVAVLVRKSLAMVPGSSARPSALQCPWDKLPTEPR